ncbi:MAG: hypothetical protein AAAC47_16375, partial [Pararhizobium sp.]
RPHGTGGRCAMLPRRIAGVLKRGFQACARKLPKFVLPNWLARLAARVDPGLKLIIPELGRDARGRDRKRAPFAPVPKADRRRSCVIAIS